MNSSTFHSSVRMFFWGQGEDTMFIFGCLEHEARCKNEKKKEVENGAKICPGLETRHKDPSFGSAGVGLNQSPAIFQGAVKLLNFGDLVV